MNIRDAIAEIQQPRSRYQLIHFVLGQHDTPEMQFYQLMLELQDMGFKLRMAQISLRKTEVEIARLLETGDELDALEAEEKQVGMEQTQIVMKGAQREIAILEDIFNTCQHYTRDEIEHAQPDYWEKRLTRQTNLQIMAGNVGWAQLDSMSQIGLLDQTQPSNGQQEIEQCAI
jgi:superfamily II RNA helicase